MNSFEWTTELIEVRIRNSFYEYDVNILNNSNHIYPQNLFIFDGKSFVIEMYRSILMREPDAKGLQSNLKLLNNKIPKSYILYSLIKSKEGKIMTKNKIINDRLTLIFKYYIYKIIKPFSVFNKKMCLDFHKKIVMKYNTIAKKYE